MVIIFNYKINEKIGKGSYSSVYAAHNIDNKTQEFAIKVIKMNKISEQIKSKIKLEVDILSKIKHNNIITLYDSFYHEGLLYLVLEKCRTDLHKEINSKQLIEVEMKINWIKQLMSGLIYLHKNKIIHRDLKPQNILLDKNNQLKIIDFGFARYFESDDLMNTICGSPLYMGPELFISNTYDYKSDYWSMGIIIYLIMVGHMPYHAKNIMELVSKLRNITDIKIPINIKNLYDDDIINMTESMLIISTKYRINYDDLLMHPFIIKNRINPIIVKTELNKSHNAINELLKYDDYISPTNKETNDEFDFSIDDLYENPNTNQSDITDVFNVCLDSESDSDTNININTNTNTNTDLDCENFESAKMANSKSSNAKSSNAKSKPILIPITSFLTPTISMTKPNLYSTYTNTKSIPIPTSTPIPNNFKDNNVELKSSDDYLLNNTFIYKNYFSAPTADNLIDNIKLHYGTKNRTKLDLKPSDQSI